MKRSNFPRRREQRHKEAVERQTERNKRDNKGQIARLDAGGFTAKRERARLGK